MTARPRVNQSIVESRLMKNNDFQRVNQSSCCGDNKGEPTMAATPTTLLMDFFPDAGFDIGDFSELPIE